MAIDLTDFSDVTKRESYSKILVDNINFFGNDSTELLRIMTVCLGGNLDLILNLYSDGDLERAFTVLNKTDLIIYTIKQSRTGRNIDEIKDLVSFLRKYIQYLKAICASKNLPRPVNIPLTDNEIMQNVRRLASLSES